MPSVNKKESLILIVGDIFVFVFSLWITLSIRYFEFPSAQIWNLHLLSFTGLFFIWIIFFYIGGLFERHTIIFRNALPRNLFNIQLFNSATAVIFFYFIPYFKITPKTILFIYLIISGLFIFTWRIYIFPFFFNKNKQNGIIIGDSSESNEILEEINNNSFYDFKITEKIKPDYFIDKNFVNTLSEKIKDKNIEIIILDSNNPEIYKITPDFYNLIFSQVKFFNQTEIYESIFNKIPISLINHNWFLDNVSTKYNLNYDSIKRFSDIIFAIIIGLISLILYPFIILLIKINDGGHIFYIDNRFGKHKKIIKLIKFRTMTDSGDNKSISKIGSFLRKFRLDELPQIWNVLKGDMSFIGPRPEQVNISNIYEKDINFYDARGIIRPGLSGWAQLKQENHPHHSVNTEATREKLSYDLFYIKNRSFWLDFKIALQTIGVILSRKGK